MRRRVLGTWYGDITLFEQVTIILSMIYACVYPLVFMCVASADDGTVTVGISRNRNRSVGEYSKGSLQF